MGHCKECNSILDKFEIEICNKCLCDGYQAKLNKRHDKIPKEYCKECGAEEGHCPH